MTLRTHTASLLLILGTCSPLVAHAHGVSTGEGCPGAQVAEDKAAPAQRPAERIERQVESPALPRVGSGEGPTRAPRWHSFLPGMFR